MKIPTSVIVMSLITAVPFAFAIRDTVKHHGEHNDLDFDGSRARARAERSAMEMYEEQARAEAAASAEADREKTARLLRLFGPTPASLGPAFEGIELGALDSSLPESTLQAIQRQADSSIQFTHSGGRLTRVVVELYDHCYALQSKLEHGWGVAEVGILPVWIDREKRQRAVLDAAACTLAFERYAEPSEWIDRTETAVVPLGLIGQPITKSPTGVGDPTSEDTSGIRFSWSGLGLGRGTSDTEIEASTNNGKIVGLDITVQTDRETAEAVRARLTQLYGTPKQDEVYGYSDWTGKLPIHFETTSTHLLIKAGKLPQ